MRPSVFVALWCLVAMVQAVIATINFSAGNTTIAALSTASAVMAWMLCFIIVYRAEER